MKELYLPAIFSVLFVSILNAHAQQIQSLEPYTEADVGDIYYLPFVDDPVYKIYNKGFIPQYYQVKGGYIGGRKKILAEFKEKVGVDVYSSIDGFVTIRFIVNCEGKAGRFRILMLDKEYRQRNFDRFFIDKLLCFTNSLSNWKVASINGTKTDYYQYITFVINGTKVSDIMP
ncbi:hypothetical protein H8S90_10405 [Olivibacter sp. SDN3]|uniref:hypothetical protein n=1 Tax=Olivibacter sp. SDN3 TaxID=2764720 RepID=UPI0016512B94|nr:hypothetical protein [Olivibacter sp. SDN3]QNL51945.1 hypothetical protein H8S90_10405 [Olivibacter sp. SDN3]